MDKRILIIICMLGIILFIPFIFATPQISIQENDEKWNVIKSDGEESKFKVIFTDLKDKKTDVCFVLKNPLDMFTTDLSDKKLYDSSNQSILDNKDKEITIKYETSKCLDNFTMKDGYHISLTEAQAINIDEYIKLGENSLVMVYQNESKVLFSINNNNNNITTTLYWDVNGDKSNWDNTINDLFVFFNNDKWKFGAYHNESSGWERYKYVLSSDAEIINKNNNWYFKIGNGGYKTDFSDICDKELINGTQILSEGDGDTYESPIVLATANCQFDSYATTKEIYDEEVNETYVVIDKYVLEVEFYSDSFIDPSWTYENLETKSTLNNVRFEGDNSTHLEISETAPYNSLVLYMPFDSNLSQTTVYDYTNADWDFDNNFVNHTTGLYGGAYNFSSSSTDYMDADGADRSPNMTAWEGMTSSAWVYWNPTAINDEHTIISNLQAEKPSFNFQLEPDCTNCIEVKIETKEGSLNHEFSDITITANTWTFVSITYNITSGIITAYKDGVATSSPWATGSTGFDNGTTPNEWRIGKETGNQGGSEIFVGKIDELMVFNRTLSATELDAIMNNQSARFKQRGTQIFDNLKIENNNKTNLTIYTYQTLFNSNMSARIGEWESDNGYNVSGNNLSLYLGFNNNSLFGDTDANPYDYSGNNHNGTVVGAVWNSSGKYGGGFEFDGNNDHIDLGTSPTGNFNEITVSVWARPKEEKYHMVLEDGDDYNTNSFFVYIKDNTTQVEIYTTAGYDALTFNENISINEWSHIVLTWKNGTRIKGYLNGIEATGELTGNLRSDSLVVGNKNLTVGGRPNVPLTHDFNGTIDEVGIWNRSLSDKEIYDLYGKGLLNRTWSSPEAIVNGKATLDINTTTIYIVPEITFNAGTSNFYSPLFWGNVTIETYTSELPYEDDHYPIFTNIGFNITNGTEYSGLSYLANATVTSVNSATVKIEFDGINYSASNVGDLFSVNLGKLSAGDYPYYWSGHGDGVDLLYNHTDTFVYSVAINSSLELGLTGTTPITYGATTDFTESGCPVELTCSLNVSDAVYAAGSVFGNYSTAGNENYTATSTIFEIVINEDMPSGSLVGTTPILNGQAGDVEGSESNTGDGDVSYELFREGTLVSNPDTDVLSPGIYDYIYNTTGGQNWTANVSLDTFTLVINPKNTSYLGISVPIPDTTFSSSTDVLIHEFKFNTSATNTNIGMLNSIQVEKLTGAGVSDIYLNITIENISIYDDKIRTINNKNQPGVSGTSPLFYNLSNGEHSMKVYARRTGNGAIALTNWDFSMGKYITPSGINGRGNYTSVDEFFQSTTPVTIFSKEITKIVNTSTYISGSFTVNASGQTDVICRFENGGVSPYFIVGIPDDTSSRTFSASYITSPANISDNLNISCFDTNNEIVTLSGGFIEADMADNNNDTINHLSTTNNNTNYTNTVTLTAGDNEIMSANITIQNGTNILISADSSTKSLTGEQTPLHYVHAENMSGYEICRSNKSRYTSGDIGNVFFFPVCEGLEAGMKYQISFHIVVEDGEQLELLDEAGTFFENTEFDTTTINTPPLVTISIPQDADVIYDNQIINWTISDPQNFLINVTANNGTNTTEIIMEQYKGIINASWNTTTIADGYWNITVLAYENDTTELLSGNNTVQVYVDNTAPILNITYPMNTTYSEVQTELNYTFTEINQDSCWYSNDSGLNNYSVTCGNNVTGLNSGEGSSTWIVWVNDTVGHESSSNVTFSVVIPDTEYPIFSDFKEHPSDPVVYLENAIYEINSTIINTNGTAGIEFNGINYTMSNISSIFNSTVGEYSVGIYNYSFWAYGNGSDNNFNSTDTFNYTIEINSIYALDIQASTPITYGTTTNFVGNDCPNQLTCNLNISDAVYPAGTVSANYSTGGNENFTANSIVFTVTIDKDIPQGPISGTTPINYGTAGNVEGTESNTGDADVVYQLFRDDTLVSNPDTSTLGAGSYDYIYNTTGGQNWTANASMDTFTLVVNEVASQTNLTFDKTSPQDYLTEITPTCSVITGEGIAVLKQDGNIITSGVAITLGVNTYTFNCSLDSTQNYTASSNASDFIIDQISSEVSTYLNHSKNNITIGIGDSIWLNGTRETGEGIIKLYNDGVLINSGATPLSNFTTFNVGGLFNITTIYEATQNYTADFETFWVNVTSVDDIFPTFTNIDDNNGTLNNSGIVIINSTITDSNGTSWVSFNGVNYSMSNVSDFYNTSFNIGTYGTYNYTVNAYGNGSDNNFNQSAIQSYTINLVVTDKVIYRYVNFNRDKIMEIWDSQLVKFYGLIMHQNTDSPEACTTNSTGGQYFDESEDWWCGCTTSSIPNWVRTDNGTICT